MKNLIAMPLLWASVSVWGACDESFPKNIPVVPDGQLATLEQMHEAQMATLAYVEAGKSYLNCRTNLSSRSHNRKVRSIERVAKAYNRELAKFENKSDLLAAK